MTIRRPKRKFFTPGFPNKRFRWWWAQHHHRKHASGVAPVVPPLTSFTINIPSGVKHIGGSGKATVSNPIPAEAAPHLTGIEWSSLNTNIATIDSTSGVITYKAVGNATIRATVNKGQPNEIHKDASLQVVALIATAFDVSIPAGDKAVGAAAITATLTNIQPSGASVAGVVWSTNNANIATVNANTGEINFVGAGSARISATLGTGPSAVTAHADITVVVPALKSFSVTVSNDPKVVGGTGTATATNANPPGAASRLSGVTWSSHANNVIQIDAQGHLQYKAEGTAVITGTVGNIYASANIAVTKPPVTSFNIASDTTPTVKGQVATFHIENVSPSSGDQSSLTFTSSNPAVARVTDAAAGTVLYVAGGDAEIQADIDGVTDHIGIHVLDASFSIAHPAAPIQVGQTHTFESVAASRLPANLDTSTIVWATTAHASIATVTPQGVLTAIGAGPVHITATVGNFVANYDVVIIP